MYNIISKSINPSRQAAAGASHWLVTRIARLPLVGGLVGGATTAAVIYPRNRRSIIIDLIQDKLRDNSNLTMQMDYERADLACVEA